MHFDLPHDVLDEPWERQITVGELKRTYSQFLASTTSEKHVVMYMHKPTDSAIVAEGMSQSNLTQCHNFFWYKTHHQTPTSPNLMVNAVEMGTIGYFPNANNVQNFLSKDPHLRHNFISLPHLTKYATYDGGTKVNASEKPPGLMSWLCKNYAAPGSTVLILGAGAGGDVLGAIEARCNVVAVERDIKQFNQLKSILFSKNAEVLVKRELELKEQNKEMKAKNSTTDKVISPSSGSPYEKSSSSSSSSSSSTDIDCIECGSILVPGFDPAMVCYKCELKKPLHPNCCSSITVEGVQVYICDSCKDNESK